MVNIFDRLTARPESVETMDSTDEETLDAGSAAGPELNGSRDLALGATSAVAESTPAGEQPPNGLTDRERELYVYLRKLEKGRLEQEMVPREQVMTEFVEWRAS